jgi:hypothetical protein
VIGEYYEWLAMIAIGLMSIFLIGTAFNSERPMAVRWSSFWLGLIFMGFEVCIVVTNFGFVWGE